MLIFDRIRLQDIDRRSWQLWVLAIVMILVLAGGLALHMYTLATGSRICAEPARNAGGNDRHSARSPYFSRAT